METATLDPPVETDPTPMPHDPSADGTGDPNAPDPPGADDPTEPDEQAQAPEELHVEGDEGHLTTDAGGKSPTDSKLLIMGKAIEVEGQFKKGQRVRATVELEIGAVHFRDKRDTATGQIVACTRTADARVVGFARQS